MGGRTVKCQWYNYILIKLTKSEEENYLLIKWKEEMLTAITVNYLLINLITWKEGMLMLYML